MRNKLRRPLAFLLSAVMIVTMSGTPVHAVADRGQPETGLCEHHAAHTDDCGYTEETPGTPCGHEHTEDCYTEVTECVGNRGQRIGQRGYPGKCRGTGAGKLPPYLRWGKRLYYGKIRLPA